MNEMNNLIQTLTIVENVEEFIPIYKTDKGEKVVKGRELHQGLCVKKDFTNWIKNQLEIVAAVENTDFFRFAFKVEGNNATLHEYILKLEIAKEICLVAGASSRANEVLKQKSKSYRKYLIQFEEKYKNQAPQLTEKQMLQLQILNGDEVERIGALKQYEGLITKPLLETIEIQKPKVNYFDTFMNSKGCYTSTQVAKLFKLPSARKLNTILNENKIIYKQGNNWLPYSTTNKEWFKVTVGERNTHNYSQLKFTPKGIYELSKLLGVTLNEEDLQEITNDD